MLDCQATYVDRKGIEYVGQFRNNQKNGVIEIREKGKKARRELWDNGRFVQNVYL